jgi:hypothetical protein
MQKRSWNYKADDKTRDINRWLTGLLSPGLYFGFDFAPSANMNLTLNHNTTGFKDVDDQHPTPVESGFQSLVVTRQGVFVKEDAAITINGITNGDATHPRVDVVVLSHRINEVAGGETALYSIIEGVPAAVPAAPAPTNSNTQIKIGELYIPAGTTALNQVGVTWSRSAKPGFAGLTITPSRVLVSNSSGQIIASAITDTELAYLSGLSVNVQTGKQNTITGAATTILTSNLTADRVVVSNGAGKVIASIMSVDELEDLIALTPNRALVSSGAGKVIVSAVTLDQLNRLAGVNEGRVVTSIESASLAGYKFRIKVLEIGDWNMDSSQTKTVAHSLDAAKIRSVFVTIRNDTGDTLPFNGQLFNPVNSTSSNQWETWFPVTTVGWNSTNIVLLRMDGSFMDGAAYDSTGYNRGWVTIQYEVNL